MTQGLNGTPTSEDQEGLPDYRSYLVRLWRTSRDGKAVWRASVEAPLTHETKCFADLAGLFAFLQTQSDGEGRG
ncbi:MAG: hypothetical protein ACJ78Q_09215 [Chloroflexia bacterium]